MKMSIENAVNYAMDKQIAIRVPNRSMWDKLGCYIKKLGIDWLPVQMYYEYKSETCVEIKSDETCYCSLDWFVEEGYKLIDIIDKSSITIRAEGDKIVASYGDNVEEIECDNLITGAQIALGELIDKINNSSKFDVGDIVEVIGNSNGAEESTIGLQGIIIPSDYGIKVKFPIDFGGGINTWYYAESDLKMIRQA